MHNHVRSRDDAHVELLKMNKNIYVIKNENNMIVSKCPYFYYSQIYWKIHMLYFMYIRVQNYNAEYGFDL